MPLYPLCRHGRRPREAVRFAAEVIERKVPDPADRSDDLFLLSIFGGLAYPQFDLAQIIGREKMYESKIGREFRQEGRLEARRLDILESLEARFGAEAKAEAEPLLEAMTDFEELGRLHRLAVTCANVAAFRAALPRRRASR